MCEHGNDMIDDDQVILHLLYIFRSWGWVTSCHIVEDTTLQRLVIGTDGGSLQMYKIKYLKVND